jgi:hypothetical protein
MQRDGDGRDAMAGKKPWSLSATKKGHDDHDRRELRDRRKDASHHLDACRTSSDDESPNDRNDTDVDEDDDSRLAASSDADDNFAVAMAPPAKRAKTIRGSAVAAKETAPARKRKATAPLIMVGKEEPTADPLECHFSVSDDIELMKFLAYLPDDECYLNLPVDSAVDNPLDMENDQRTARC